MGVESVENKEVEEPTGSRTGSSSAAEDVEDARDDISIGPVPIIVDQTQRPASTSSGTRAPINVPRSERRGWLASLSIIKEVEDPKDYARSTKWAITAIVAAAAAAAPMGSGIVLPALSDIERVFNASAFTTNLSISFYMLSMAIFPLWWSSFSETLGRRTIYLSSFLVYFVFNVLSAESQNISMFIAMRVFAGGASASVQAVGAGTIADVWDVRERGRAMGIFYLGPLCGPLISPIVGGALAEGLGWSSIMWFQVIFGAIIWFLILFFLPETLKARKSLAAEAEQEVMASVTGEKNNLEAGETGGGTTLTRVSTKQSVKIKTKKYVAMTRRCLVDPLAIILNLRSPAVALTVYYASVTFGCLYVLNISVEQTFSSKPYGYSTIIVGLMYIPNSLGYFVSSLLGGKWVDHIMHREARKAGRYDENGKLVFRPEDRMRENVWLGAFMYPTALIWYGWSVQEGVFWLCPVSTSSTPVSKRTNGKLI